VVYASSTGHTEFVIDELIATLGAELKDSRIVKQRAELTKPEDLMSPDVLVLACGSWNTGNVEGQLNPHMHDLLLTRSPEVTLAGKPVAAIGLGDERYHFTARAAEKLTTWLTAKQGSLLLPTLKVINEPFDQKPKVQAWAKELADKISALPLKK
jgi:flavodoxin